MLEEVAAARDRLVRQFQDQDGPPRVFVLSLKAGGTGLNLTRASHVFHFDRWWNPAVEDQATDRAYRIGQTRRVLVYRFLTAGTVEEKIDRMLEGKREFRCAGAALFPAAADDLETACSCPDWANPCKHIAAAHTVLGDLLDRDPFLLFQLRGRTRAQVLAALRRIRARAAGAEPRTSGTARTAQNPSPPSSWTAQTGNGTSAPGDRLMRCDSIPAIWRAPRPSSGSSGRRRRGRTRNPRTRSWHTPTRQRAIGPDALR
jgi:hypothetical protein